jgi:DNA (cytosine-5)-methyltransferase 1
MRDLACRPGSRVRFRTNIKLSNELDAKLSELEIAQRLTTLQGCLLQNGSELKVIDLFAGAGGMGLGFLSASNKNAGYRVISVAEIDPIYLSSLNTNYVNFAKAKKIKVSECCSRKFEPIDLTKTVDRSKISDAVSREGGVDVLIGGSPCQGFSQANRTSWSPDNPFNRLVEYFIKCAEELKPKIVLMENVQGILWTNRKGKSQKQITVADHVAQKLSKAGYILFPSVLDAAWYGVPQHRNRFFLLAMDKSLGYTEEDFGEWGAFPIPTHGQLGQRDYITVRQAISDLPVIDNGENRLLQDYTELSPKELDRNQFLEQMRYLSSGNMIEGHVVSKQAEYVIDRYKNVPEGGNWKNIRHMMTNYSDIERTHSNIYRRLTWDQPSITIGNYRKSMIIHPSQDRGLSLREAARLQSLPDWFTFFNSTDTNVKSGLVHKQQQLANAVSFLLTQAIAKYILNL